MSLATKIEIEDNATPGLIALQGRVSPQRMAAELGPRCTRLVQRHLRQNGPNKKGWPTTNFWPRAAKATNWQEGAGFVDIVTNQIGVRQRLLGGPIKPVNAGALTIPIAPEAYGRRASEFADAFIAHTAKGAFIVVKEGKGKEAKLKFLFFLAKGVNQEPDPDVMPTDEDFAQTFDESFEALTNLPI
jgi:hypothetical protein